MNSKLDNEEKAVKFFNDQNKIHGVLVNDFRELELLCEDYKNFCEKFDYKHYHGACRTVEKYNSQIECKLDTKDSVLVKHTKEMGSLYAKNILNITFKNREWNPRGTMTLFYNNNFRINITDAAFREVVLRYMTFNNTPCWNRPLGYKYERDYEIFSRFYMRGHTIKELADGYPISENRIEQVLKNFENNLIKFMLKNFKDGELKILDDIKHGEIYEKGDMPNERRKRRSKTQKSTKEGYEV